MNWDSILVLDIIISEHFDEVVLLILESCNKELMEAIGNETERDWVEEHQLGSQVVNIVASVAGVTVNRVNSMSHQFVGVLFLCLNNVIKTLECSVECNESNC